MNNSELPRITVVGAGLAGSEAAWQAAERGVKVHLIEMKPQKRTPAHHADGFAELVCSNSLRSDEVTVASGLLKAELRIWGSLVMEAADATKVAAGSALAVNRELFSEYITQKLKSHPLIETESAEVKEIPHGITVIATGPLTSDALAENIKIKLGRDSLSFYDAAAPIIDFDSIDMSRAFFASRWGKGEADYINCPMNKEEYLAFYNELIHAETAHLHDVDGDPNIFEGCMPVEIMASRGEDTLRYGPVKPVGISNPVTGENYYAVVQLRRENSEGTMYNIVGFQTHLTFSEQRRVFSLIPGLEKAEFIRYGVMHRNTYINSPGLLNAYYSLEKDRDCYFAGQMTGVEGYIESAASGFVAGLCAGRRARRIDEFLIPSNTVTGALAKFVSTGSLSGSFQPMNANFGIVDPLGFKVKGGKRPRMQALADRAIKTAEEIKCQIKI